MKKTPKSTNAAADADDAALFRAAVGTVQPLARQNRVTIRPAPRIPVLRPRAPPPAVADRLSDFNGENAPEEYLSNGLSRMTLRKLRRGAWRVEDSFDLHGHHADVARRLLQEFLHKASQHRQRCVLVIHGKGLNSQGGEAVLRRLARHWLSQHPLVLAYCDAPPKSGGNGATLVLLKAVS